MAIRGKGWLAGSLATVLGLGILTGCQPTYLMKENYESSLLGALNVKPSDTCPPDKPLTNLIKAPPTVDEPERPQRPMTLQEAIALALEGGTVNPNAPGTGTSDPTFARFPGAGSLNSETDQIRVLALNPAIANTNIEASEARFDPIWVSGLSWTNTDGLAGVPNVPGYLGGVPGQTANFQSSIIKAFSSGGVANVSFITDYRYVNLNNAQFPQFTAPMNPQWAPRLSFGFEQPLWRDFGSDINSLLPRIPGITGSSLIGNLTQVAYNNNQGLISSSAGNPIEGTLISRLRQDQSRAEFERNVQIMVLNVEVAYWNLYNKYGQLYSFEENLRILQKVYQESYPQWKAGRLGGDKYFQFKAQFEEYRGERFRAMQELLDAERELRRLTGMPLEDGTRITPITPPNLAQLRPNWDTCLQDTLSLSPELILARENLRYHQYLMQIQKNNLKPDLRAYARVEPFGNGTSLIGGGTPYTDSSGVVHSGDAFRSLAGGHLVDSEFGLYMNVPLGFRAEYAAIRSARLQLTQSYYFLRDAEERKIAYLDAQYQNVSHWYQRLKAARTERIAYVEALKFLNEQIKAGKINYSDQQNGLEYLTLQRGYANALVKEYASIAEYNNTVARLEWAKGTVLTWNNVHISEGPLPQCAQERATEYEARRSRSLALRQTPDSLAQPAMLCMKRGCDLKTLEGPDGVPPVLPPAPLPTESKPAESKPMSAPAQPKSGPSQGKLPEATSSKNLEQFKPVVPPPAPLPSPRQADDTRLLSKQATSGVQQTGAAEQADVLTPIFRSEAPLQPSVAPAISADTPLQPTAPRK